ncbi:thiaminase II [Sagittula stellata]|uniref:Aminopyrimidine aminohydrolase n=1 Tax=Sagittula stellata (strain ATCC 700073 / DSM 11524 / E-37) TaxID=388399 RepID=A3K896_SAGS3|nr:thiaminase II [Sagittula stellata]EBA06575.1 putative transcriptional activator (TenA family) protein [Sagittula stellata E-37]
MTFTDDLAAQTQTLRTRIHEMPFNTDMATGQLRRDVFQGYIVQDALYLEGFARALSLAAARAPDPATVAQLANAAAGAIAVERELHTHYMDRFGVSETMLAAMAPSAACDHYVSFLLRTSALGPFDEAVAALLPCFWIYRDVGHDIAARSAPDNPYAAWIDTYSGEAFDESVARMLDLTDRLGAEADGLARLRMSAAFERACWHEWRFWDSAYRMESWMRPEDSLARDSRAPAPTA